MTNLFRVEPPANPSPNADNIIANTKLLKNTVGWVNKNLFDEEQTSYAIFGDSQGAYINSSTNAYTLIAHISKDTDYTVSKKNGVGDSFIVAGFVTHPTIPNTTPETNSEVIIDDNSINTYTFNSDDFEYIAFTVNKSASGSLSGVEAMIRDANVLDNSYEPMASTQGTVKDFINQFSAPLSTQGLTPKDSNISVYSGGYRIIGNMCFISMVVKMTTFTTYNYGNYIMNGFPMSTTEWQPLNVKNNAIILDSFMSAAIKNGALYLSNTGASQSSPDYYFITGWYELDS